MRIADVLPGLCRGRTALAALAIMAALASPAAATATLTCDIKDANVTFDLMATTGRGDGTIVGIVGGSLKMKGAKDEVPVTFQHLAQQWSYEKDRRIGFRIEQEGDAPNFHLVIIARGVGDEGKYAGRYVLKVEGGGTTKTFKGKVTNCEEG
jgi:polyisoprenoid-binding protein YceI